MMTSDYPAAHSMDTTWFAVDRDGHIAVFDSGEDGAVPVTASDNGFDLIREVFMRAPFALLNAPPESPLHTEWTAGDGYPESTPEDNARALAELQRRYPGAQVQVTRAPEPQMHRVAMLLWSVEVLNDLWVPNEYLKPQVGGPVQDGRLYPVWFETLTRGNYELLHKAGVCCRCACADHLKVGDIGLFGFNNDGYGLAPYEGISYPVRPLQVDELPETLRKAVSEVSLPDVSFAEAPYIQPIEHVPCNVWSAGAEDLTYLASDMQTRKPLPRR